MLKLVAVRSIGPQSHHKCYLRAAVRSFTAARSPNFRANTIAASASIQTSHASRRAQPHSVRRTDGARPIAISCLGAFWTPADQARGCHCIHRHPKTCTQHTAQAEVKRLFVGPEPAGHYLICVRGVCEPSPLNANTNKRKNRNVLETELSGTDTKTDRATPIARQR